MAKIQVCGERLSSFLRRFLLRHRFSPSSLTTSTSFDGYRMLRSQTVTVQDGIIQEVQPSTAHLSARSAINGRGKTLPELIDAHCHIAGEESLEQAAALGVTTELDMFGYPDLLMPIRKALAHGEYPNAADFRTAGIGANVPAAIRARCSRRIPFRCWRRASIRRRSWTPDWLKAPTI